MKLYLNNVGVIKDSTIMLDGLTVITGKNSSGKTTVGKTMYSLLSASNDLEEAFENSKRRYIISKISDVGKVLKISRLVSFRLNESHRSKDLLFVLATKRFLRFDNEQLQNYLYDLNNRVDELSLLEYIDYFYSDNGYMSIETVKKHFEDWKKQALDIIYTTNKFILEDQSYYIFNKDRTRAFLTHEFNNQIKPVKHKRCVSTIRFFDNETDIVDIKVRSNSSFEFSNDSSFYYPFDRCIYIDNPYIIDDLDKYNYIQHSQFGMYDARQMESFITSEYIKDHNEILCDLLLNHTIKNFFDHSELQDKYKEVFEKINKIVPGEFEQDSEGYYYISNGSRLSVKNLATGSKMFFIIKKLLINGLINDKTMLILDEPESHLHPEWINKFAEILVALIKEIKVNVLLTTHSPNLLLALNVYSKKMNIEKNSHFYLAEKMDDGYFSQIRNIDNSIGEGYSHLSIPIVEMNLELEKFNGE